MKYRLFKAFFLFLTCLLMLGATGFAADPTEAESTPPEEKRRSMLCIDYPAMPLETMVEEADCIVYGEVLGAGPLQFRGEDAYGPYTPYVIRPLIMFKGECQGATLCLNQHGGENDEYIIESDDFTPMQPGDRYILFLNAMGYDWGRQSRFLITDDEGGFTLEGMTLLIQELLENNSQSHNAEV